MNKLLTEWHPKKPSKSINKTLVDFQILKRLSSNKTTDKKGHSKRDFTNIEAEVLLFYYDINNKHLAHILKKRGFLTGLPLLPKFNGNVSFEKNYRDRNQSNVSRKDMVSEAKRYADFILIIKGEPSKVLTESLKKVKGSGHNRVFLTDWENVTTYNFNDHINYVEELAVKEIAGDAVQFGIYNQHDPSDILLAKIKLSEQSFETISQRTGVPLTMIYRHTQNKAPIGRQHAIQYAKYFGMDPSEILFNDISLPLAGEVSFENKSPGEVKKDFFNLELTKCPRDIYRPDIQCVKVNSPESIYNNCNLFYYQDFQGEIQNNQLCIFMILGEPGAGTDKNIQGVGEDEPYKVIGRFSKNEAGEISIRNPDPNIYEKIITDNINKTQYERADLTKSIIDMNETHCTLNEKFLNRHYIKKIGILGISPIIAVVNRELTIKDEKRASIIKEEDAWYASRTLAEGNSIKKNFSKIPNDKVKAEYYTPEEADVVAKQGTVAERLEADYQVDIEKLEEKLKIIETKVRDMGYRHFQLPAHAPDIEVKNDNGDSKYIEIKSTLRDPLTQITSGQVPQWLIDPDLPVSVDEFIQKDPKAAAKFFNNEDDKLSKEFDLKFIIGEARGEDRAKEAAESAMSMKATARLRESTEVLIVITGSKDVKLYEVDTVINEFRKKLNPNTEMVFGVIVDENMEDKIRVSVMSTSQGTIKDQVLIKNALSNFYFYRSIGARKEALRLALGSPTLTNSHRDEVIKIISEKTPEVLQYKKAEIYPFRKVS